MEGKTYIGEKHNAQSRTLVSGVPPKKESNYNVSLEGQKGGQMARKGFTPEQIINKLREKERN